MAQSIRISDDLYSMAQNASKALGRPLAQQMEYWARLGAALDASGISTSMAMDLLGNGANADEFVAAALGRGRHVAWDRRQIQDGDLVVGESVTIHQSGRVERPCPSKGLGR